MRSVIVLTLIFAAAASAQQPTTVPATAFETASIHPVKLTPGCASMLPPGGVQYAVTCMTLRNLIEMAYNSGYIEGGGAALDAYYDFRASVPGDKPWTYEMISPMMQQFLIERFHLAVHKGKREISGYSLVLAKSGSKLKAIDPDPAVQGLKAGEAASNFVAPGVVQGRSEDPKGIAGLLGMAVHAPVEDHTGLKGIYNIDLQFAPDSLSSTNSGNQSDTGLPSFFTAVEEQLGLKLQSAKIAVDTVVIDHVDAEPTPN